MVSPDLLCDNHLRGEHYEIHKLIGHIRHGRRLGKYATDKLVDPSSIVPRHDELVKEMIRRGMNHESPVDITGLDLQKVSIDLEYNLIDLSERCEKCRQRISTHESARSPKTRLVERSRR